METTLLLADVGVCRLPQGAAKVLFLVNVLLANKQVTEVEEFISTIIHIDEKSADNYIKTLQKLLAGHSKLHNLH